MAVLKDFYCNQCDNVIEVSIDMNQSELVRYCEVCNRWTKYYSACNGGLNSRWRYCDFDFSNDREMAKHIRIGKGEAVDADERPILDGSGKAIHDREKFSQDNVNNEIDKKITEIERKKGKRPIYIGAK